jgi:hypothetical protein
MLLLLLLLEHIVHALGIAPAGIGEEGHRRSSMTRHSGAPLLWRAATITLLWISIARGGLSSVVLTCPGLTGSDSWILEPPSRAEGWEAVRPPF